MLGATLAAGPRMAREVKGRLNGARETVSEFGGIGGVLGLFHVIELQLMVHTVVFSVSSLVPKICISSFSKVQETFSQISGYCEQNDIHSPQVTILESLVLSAWL